MIIMFYSTYIQLQEEMMMMFFFSWSLCFTVLTCGGWNRSPHMHWIVEAKEASSIHLQLCIIDTSNPTLIWEYVQMERRKKNC
jgi:hypothetical protein